MLNYIMEALIVLVVIYCVSYLIKHGMIMKARKLFEMSHLGNRKIGRNKWKEMNIKILNKTKLWDTVAVKDLAFELLKQSDRDIGKIWNMFNWRKPFIYGNEFVYKKYIAILGTIEVNRIFDKIHKLEKKLNRITVNSVLQGYGVQDSKRNKVLAGIDKSGVDIHEPECTVTVLMDPEGQREAQAEFMEKFRLKSVEANKKYARHRKEKYIERFVKNKRIKKVLAGTATQDDKEVGDFRRELKNKIIDTDDMKPKRVTEFFVAEDEVDVNKTLKDRGIKIED